MSATEINWDDYEETWYEECPRCKGGGSEGDEQISLCSRCNGKGYIPHVCNKKLI